MSITATLETIIGFLDNGTGDPGLQFSATDEDTLIVQVREHEHSDLWIVHPVDVTNSTDAEEHGPHERCLLCVTICMDADTDEPIYRFLGLDPWGQPIAYHEVG